MENRLERKPLSIVDIDPYPILKNLFKFLATVQVYLEPLLPALNYYRLEAGSSGFGIKLGW